MKCRTQVLVKQRDMPYNLMMKEQTLQARADFSVLELGRVCGCIYIPPVSNACSIATVRTGAIPIQLA